MKKKIIIIENYHQQKLFKDYCTENNILIANPVCSKMTYPMYYIYDKTESLGRSVMIGNDSLINADGISLISQEYNAVITVFSFIKEGGINLL